MLREWPTPPVADPEPAGAPSWLIFVTHGIGEGLLNPTGDEEVGAIRFRRKVNMLRKGINSALSKRNLEASASCPALGRIELLPIEWLMATHSESMVKTLQRSALPTLERARDFVNLAMRDGFLYMQPEWQNRVLKETREQLDEKLQIFCKYNPDFKDRRLRGEAGIALLGHSLGTVILCDLLSSTNDFRPDALFMFGSPTALFACIRGHVSLPGPPVKPTFNIFHPHDPIAYRLEPLLTADSFKLQPARVPYQGGQRLHVALGNFGSAIAGWWGGGVGSGGAGDVNVEEIEKLNGGFRVDWEIQPSPGEAASEWLSAVSSHFTYWTHEDVLNFVVEKLQAVTEKRSARFF